MRARDQRGAVAVMVGVLATVLFGVAALAVDLGNAWARSRAVQKQVDVSALGAGHLLPASPTNQDAIAAAVAAYLDSNRAPGQPDVAAADLRNGSLADGEVAFEHADGTACTSGCLRLTVTAPAARVDFGLAGVVGHDHTDVQRSATVQLVSALPPQESLVPFWLPSGCGYGPAMTDTAGGSSSGSPTATDSPAQSPPATELERGPHEVRGPAPYQAAGESVRVRGYSVVGITRQVDRASLRFYAPDRSRFVEYAAQDVGRTDPLVVPEFLVGQEVMAVPGDWQVVAVVQHRGNDRAYLSANELVFRVAGPSPAPSAGAAPTATATPAPGEPASSSRSSVPVGCVGQDRGNFGQLDSPRADQLGRNDRLATNIARGLDHQLAAYVPPPGQAEPKDCGSGTGVIPGARLDDVPVDGRNCIMGDTGNDGPSLHAGFVAGVGTVPGRLAAARRPTTCPGRSDTVVSGVPINNDVLSCFLRDGATLDSIAQPGGVSSRMLDPAVVRSPRFVWLPVVYAADRAQKGFQPIRHFVPAFITDETQTSPATPENGIEVNGGSVASFQVFTFSKEALPIDARSATIDYAPSVGSGIVRLVG